MTARYDPQMAPPNAAPHVVVVADGHVPPRAALDRAWPGWDADVASVIAADGGDVRARAIGLRPAVLVGDLDSLGHVRADEAAAAGAEIVRAAAAKDESDTELAVLEALRRGARRITVLGALGGARLDHALANVWLLAHPMLRDAEMVLLDDRSRVSLVVAPRADGGPVTRGFPGRVGGTISLFPVGGDASGITTTGLRYPLRDEALDTGPARGLSNVRERPDVSVTVARGLLLVVEIADPPGGLSSGA